MFFVAEQMYRATVAGDKDDGTGSAENDAQDLDRGDALADKECGDDEDQNRVAGHDDGGVNGCGKVETFEKEHLVAGDTEKTAEEQAGEIFAGNLLLWKAGADQPKEGNGTGDSQQHKSQRLNISWHYALGHSVVDAVDQIDDEQGDMGAVLLRHRGRGGLPGPFGARCR